MKTLEEGIDIQGDNSFDLMEPKDVDRYLDLNLKEVEYLHSKKV